MISMAKKNADNNLRNLKPGSFKYVWNHIKKNKGAMAGLIVLLILAVLCVLSTSIVPYGVNEMNMADQFATPSAKHLFGCDELGRDILVRVLYGARYTLSIGFASVAISVLIGVVVGAIAGFFGGVLDSIIMRVLDVFQAFPHLLLAILFSSVFGQGLDKAILALGIAGVPGYARMIRAQILTIRGMEYIEAATSINCTKFRIIARHVIPNAISPLIVTMAMSIASAGLSAASLSFLGLGVQPPTPEWGAMLSGARQYIRAYPHMVTIPGAFIAASVLSFNLIGDAIRDALDPKLKD